MSTHFVTDQHLLETLGERLSRHRIDAGLTQADLARQAGIGRSTVERMEAGQSTQLSSFIRVLRVFGLLQQFQALIPETGPSPMQRLRGAKAERQRASRRRATAGDKAKDWHWGED